MPTWVNRTVLSGSSVDPNGTNSHTCSFTAATSGNLLVAVVAGSVTFTTPSGWTLLESSVIYSALYVFYKTASASESSFSTTHNGSDFPIRGVIYEFAAGSTIIGTTGKDDTGPAGLDGPICTGLDGNYTRFAARAWNLTSTNSTGSVSWGLPTIEDYDVYTPDTGSANGIALSIAYDSESTGPSFTPSSTYTVTNTVAASSQNISFAVANPTDIVFVQSQGAFDGSSDTTMQATFSSPVTAGNLIIVALAYQSPSSTATVSDTQGNTYSAATGPTVNANMGSGFTSYIFYTIAGSTGSNTVVATLANTETYRRILIHEYSGVDTFDVASAATGNSATLDSGSATTTQATELIFGWGVSNNGVTDPGSNFMLRQTTQLESTEDKTVISTGNYNATFPTSSSEWICQMATFYALDTGPSMAAPISWFQAT